MLIAANNLHEYFREALAVAMRRSSLSVTENTQAYLVYLLSEFISAEKVFAGVDHGEQPTLAFLLSRAQSAEPEEALRIFKHLGDSSLYWVGFFHEATQNKAISQSYYVSMGETAYSSAATLARTKRDQALIASTVYEELSDRFGDLVDLIKLVSLHGHRAEEGALPPGQILELIERYRRTKDPEILDLLVRNGVLMDADFSHLVH